MSRCLVVQHVEPEEPYGIAVALTAAGVPVEVARPFAGEELPTTLTGWDGLVVMGGPMSAGSDDGFPSRKAELALLAEAIETGRPALGICLGAQLLAVAGGAAVYPGAAGPEIGWGTVELTADAATDELLGDLPASVPVLHWHGDTFDLPAGAIRLGSNENYANQAFRLGRRAWGLQFHVEVDATAVERFVAAFAAEAQAVGVDPAEISRSAAGRLPAREEIGRVVGGRFAALVAGTVTSP